MAAVTAAVVVVGVDSLSVVGREVVDVDLRLMEEREDVEAASLFPFRSRNHPPRRMVFLCRST